MVPTFIPDAETQAIKNESYRESFVLDFDEWLTMRQPTNNNIELRVVIGNTQ